MQGDYSEDVCNPIESWRLTTVAKQKSGLGRGLLIAGRLLNRSLKRIKELVGSVWYWRARVFKAPPSGLPPFFLHVGLPKTATTTLQNTLLNQHSGICYLGKRSGSKAEKQCSTDEIYRALRPILWHRNEPTDIGYVQSVLQTYSKAQGPEKPILGSWEGLLIKPPMQFRALLRELQNVTGDVRVVATLRNPLKRLPSAYLHAIKACVRHGTHYTIPKGRVFISFDEWLAGTHRPSAIHDPRFDFDKNLRFAAKFLGKEKLGVFLMEDMIEDHQAYFARILDFLGVEDSGMLYERKHLNEAFTTAQLEFLQAIEGSDAERARWLALDSGERHRRMAAVAREDNADKCKITLSDNQRELIAGRSRDLNRWLVDTYNLDLERHGYPL
ncbi:hypothetical protein QWI17_15915 [Gilvimarinus sp. SDUM040013]|uniref:Sulfotransferase n=1 Tax=Gilvimarinus gilvus TaxID=3058038 RepID=A0ABU4RXW5_9GAMM|nr:hypothetical protein [Gilvimarinus sp. SDUM040013]MDO3387328.1 hypothetical protein [Gilvimarinus sp. SDUM040013]MDX6849017.1 hypothetical protein [Gilvimarinus sp. SDUM040013]